MVDPDDAELPLELVALARRLRLGEPGPTGSEVRDEIAGRMTPAAAAILGQEALRHTEEIAVKVSEFASANADARAALFAAAGGEGKVPRPAAVPVMLPRGWFAPVGAARSAVEDAAWALGIAGMASGDTEVLAWEARVVEAARECSRALQVLEPLLREAGEWVEEAGVDRVVEPPLTSRERGALSKAAAAAAATLAPAARAHFSLRGVVDALTTQVLPGLANALPLAAAAPLGTVANRVGLVRANLTAFGADDVRARFAVPRQPSEAAPNLLQPSRARMNEDVLAQWDVADVVPDYPAPLPVFVLSGPRGSVVAIGTVEGGVATVGVYNRDTCERALEHWTEWILVIANPTTSE